MPSVSPRIKYRRDESNPLSLSFEIVAQLVIGQERTPALFETRLDATGRVSVIG
jgi:predicted component of type VI protein secretion system